MSDWHKADILIIGENVRFRRNSEHWPDHPKCPLLTLFRHAASTFAAMQSDVETHFVRLQSRL
jgi:hypothetical protein